jgi:hypothetical protein
MDSHNRERERLEVAMPIEPESVDEATATVAAWLLRSIDDDRLLGQRASGRIADRFMKIAGLAGFGMGIVRIDGGRTARWTHPRINGSELPDSGLSSNDEDARIRACSALLKVPMATRLLEHHRVITEI